MTTKKKIPAKAMRPRADIYQEVTDKIIAQMEKGILPWVCPWDKGAGNITHLPANGHTGNTYNGINILLLWGAAYDHGYKNQKWFTFKQA